MPNSYYIYVFDGDFGTLFVKFRSYFSYCAKLCLSGHVYLPQAAPRLLPSALASLKPAILNLVIKVADERCVLLCTTPPPPRSRPAQILRARRAIFAAPSSFAAAR